MASRKLMVKLKKLGYFAGYNKGVITAYKDICSNLNICLLFIRGRLIENRVRIWNTDFVSSQEDVDLIQSTYITMINDLKELKNDSN